MSAADDDTFEIDIYGDEQPVPEVKVEATKTEAVETGDEDIQVDFNDGDEATTAKPEDASNNDAATTTHQSENTSQGTKRKARSDEEHEGADLPADSRPLDPGALPALKLAELHWWTTEEDLRGFCVRAGAEDELCDLAFGEHKQNGKSRGEAYLEFSTPHAATAVKRSLETTESSTSAVEGGAAVKKGPFSVAFTVVGNPYKNAAAQGGKKEIGNTSGTTQNYSRGGYNNFNNRGRGNYNNNYNSRGNYGNNNMMQNRQNWNMNGMNGMGGYGNAGFNNPMMGGMMGANMNMMGFNPGMMGNNMNMMGGGGYGGMNQMGGGMNMNMRGGRGGWQGGGGYQQQQQQQGFQGAQQQQQQQGNKRAKME